jgi:hypothetical protein
MKSFSVVAFATFLLALSALPVANAQTTLPPVNVTANYCDYAANCTFASGFSAFMVPIGPAFPPNVDSIGLDDEPLVATCKSLRDRANQLSCNTNNPPPAPFFPSPTQGAWASNGCGDGSWKSEIGRYIVGYDVPGYTGDLTNPLPGVSFAPACSYHDQCYYLWAKGTCDDGFAKRLFDICNVTGPRAPACFTLRDRYVKAVENFGQGAYDTDHRNMECAKISKKLRDGDCVA